MFYEMVTNLQDVDIVANQFYLYFNQALNRTFSKSGGAGKTYVNRPKWFDQECTLLRNKAINRKVIQILLQAVGSIEGLNRARKGILFIKLSLYLTNSVGQVSFGQLLLKMLLKLTNLLYWGHTVHHR